MSHTNKICCSFSFTSSTSINPININTIRKPGEEFSKEHGVFMIVLQQAKHTFQDIANILGPSLSTADIVTRKVKEGTIIITSVQEGQK